MPFPHLEKQALRTVPGVGPKVIKRLEQLGFDNLAALAKADAAEICQQISDLMGTTCWGNSPKARAAVQGAIDMAGMVVHF